MIFVWAVVPCAFPKSWGASLLRPIRAALALLESRTVAGRCYGRSARWLGSRCVDPGNYTPRWDVEKNWHIFLAPAVENMRRNIQVLVSISNFEGCTLPETNISHLKMDGWNTIVSFWNGKFSGTVSMLVSGRVTFWTQQMEVFWWKMIFPFHIGWVLGSMMFHVNFAGMW